MTLNHGDAGSTPASASISMPCGVTGNIPLFESVDSRFKPWRGSWEVNSRLGQSPVFLPFLTPVAQSEEAAVSKPVNVRVSPNGDASRTTLARGTAGMEQRRLERLITFTSAGSIPAPVTKQVWCNGQAYGSRKLVVWVQIPSPAPMQT